MLIGCRPQLPSLVFEELVPETRPSPPLAISPSRCSPLLFCLQLLLEFSLRYSSALATNEPPPPPFARVLHTFLPTALLIHPPSFQHQHTFCFVAEYPVSLFHPSSVYPLLPIDLYGRVAYLNEALVIIFHTLLIPYYWTFGP